MAKPTQRVVGRGERVLPGIWRLRLPLPWPGVPHCNAWAIAAGDGVVLVDTGVHEPGSMGHLERALEQVGLRVEHVRLVVCTHAHADHCGQAATIAERAGCEVWMHPRSDHLFQQVEDPEAVLARRLEIARQSGVPAEPLQRWAEARRGQGPLVGAAAEGRPRARPGRRAARPTSAPGRSIETPGHAPVARLPAPARPPPAAVRRPPARPRLAVLRRRLERPTRSASSSTSLDRVDALDARLALSGHGRPFTDVRGHVDANRALVAEHLDSVRERAGRRTSSSAFDARAAACSATPSARRPAPWLFTETLAFLTHLERRGEVAPHRRATRRRWAL